jgi:hypothetical protein
VRCVLHQGGVLGLDDRHPITRIPLEAHLLVETTSGWEGIAFQISAAFILRRPFIRGTQEARLTTLIDHEQAFDRGALLLAPGECLLVLGSGRAVDRSLSTSMPTRGGGGTPAVGLAASLPTNSSAVRAGRHSWRAKACFNTAGRRCMHWLAFDWDIPKRWPCTSWLGFCFTYVSIKSRLSAIVGKGHMSYVR